MQHSTHRRSTYTQLRKWISFPFRRMTGGEGTFSWEFSHYQEVPHDLAQKILEAQEQQEAHV